MDVNVQVFLPDGTSGKMVDVKFKQKHLYVALKGQEEPLINGELDQKIKVDESYWSIEDGKYLNLNMEKATEIIWKTIVLGDKEIDPKKVEMVKAVNDFDPETQGHL